MNIGENLKKYRRYTKITQKELAIRIGKSERTIQKYESNEVIPSFETLKKIAKVLNVDINHFIEMNTDNIINKYKEIIEQQDKEIEGLKKVISKIKDIKDLMEEL